MLDDTTMTNIKTVAIVVAAGKGLRMQSDIPKQYHLHHSKPILYHTIKSLQSTGYIDRILVVIHKDHEEYYHKAIEGLEGLLPFAIGGSERQDSVLLGLQKLKHLGINPKHVLIHDAARMNVDKLVVKNLLSEVQHCDGVIPALSSSDTLKKVDDNGYVITTVNREEIFRVQTPQVFNWPLILSAHEKQKNNKLTDDAAVMEACGFKVKVIAGSQLSEKITYKADLLRLKENTMNTQYEFRNGIGYDVHRLIDGDAIILAGVSIDYHKKLEGHSDADVAMHALTDAILGAINNGDIGTHFPPSDMQWKGATSDIFLAHAKKLVSDINGLIVNCDITIVCEEPKIKPHQKQMQACLAKILNMDASRISIKATTSEKLGFTGRKEGIAAYASATVALPFSL